MNLQSTNQLCVVQKPAYRAMPLEPADLDLDPIFLSRELLFQGTI